MGQKKIIIIFVILGLISISSTLLILFSRGVFDNNEPDTMSDSDKDGVNSYDDSQSKTLTLPSWASDLGFSTPDLPILKDRSEVTSILNDEGFDSFVFVYQADSREAALKIAEELANELSVIERPEKTSNQVIIQYDNVGEPDQNFAQIIRVEADNTIWISGVNLFHLAG